MYYTCHVNYAAHTFTPRNIDFRQDTAKVCGLSNEYAEYDSRYNEMIYSPERKSDFLQEVVQPTVVTSTEAVGKDQRTGLQGRLGPCVFCSMSQKRILKHVASLL